MMGDLGFAEAYMFGDVVCEDLISTFLVSKAYSLTLPVINKRSNTLAGVSQKQGIYFVAQLDGLMALFPPSAAHILPLFKLARERPF